MTNAFTIPKTSAITKDLVQAASKAANARAGRGPSAKARHFAGISPKGDERIREQKEAARMAQP